MHKNMMLDTSCWILDKDLMLDASYWILDKKALS